MKAGADNDVGDGIVADCLIFTKLDFEERITMPKPKVIVSPVGVSLFGNFLQGEDRQTFWRLSNYQEDEVPETIRPKMQDWAAQIREALQYADISRRRKMSAELNGLYGLYPRGIAPGDYQILIATDTFVGQLAANVLEQFLRQVEHVQSVLVIKPASLSTESPDKFLRGIKNLLKELDEQIICYDQEGYEIIFNLTGGFKSLQGYLTVIAMFYADRLVYIFEQSDALLTIPRLPLKLDEDVFETYVPHLARLAAGAIIPAKQLDLPESVLDVDEDGNATLSDWGVLIWQRLKREKLAEKLLDLPYLGYETTFQKDFAATEWPDRLRLQETLVEVSNLLVESNGSLAKLKEHGGLQYDNYTNKKAGKQPIGHFRVSQGLRVSCLYDPEEKVLRLRRFGKEPEVNKNP